MIAPLRYPETISPVADVHIPLQGNICIRQTARRSAADRNDRDFVFALAKTAEIWYNRSRQYRLADFERSIRHGIFR